MCYDVNELSVSERSESDVFCYWLGTGHAVRPTVFAIPSKNFAGAAVEAESESWWLRIVSWWWWWWWCFASISVNVYWNAGELICTYLHDVSTIRVWVKFIYLYVPCKLWNLHICIYEYTKYHKCRRCQTVTHTSTHPSDLWLTRWKVSWCHQLTSDRLTTVT